MLGRTNTCGGGSGGLNFQVIGGTTAPSNPKENMIWVNTSTTISSWVFSATKPEGMQERDVWFQTGTSSSIEFNALKKNGIQVCPIAAKQYVNGSLVTVGASIYTGGSWEVFSAEINVLYDSGKFKSGYDIATSSNADSSDEIKFTKNSSYIQLNASGDMYGMFYIKPKVTRGKYKTLKISLKNASMDIDADSGMFGLASSLDVEPTKFAAVTYFESFSGDKTISVSIDSLPETSTYYVAIRFGLTSTSFAARVTKIWLE